MPAPTTPNCPLWQGLRAQQVHTVAVMGMTKNTGKTVSLNHLLAQAHAERLTVGLSSIGRDGEAHDQVYAIPKPPVRVRAGNLVATASDTLVRAKARIKLMDTTGVRSPMGEILLVKVTEAGEMEVAGASRSHDQHKVMALLRQCGADIILLDGALGRSHHASPALADGVVLATGAAIGGGIADVLRKTHDRLAILGIPAAPQDWLERTQAIWTQGGVGAWNRHGEGLLHERIATINAAENLLARDLNDADTVAVSGAVGKRLWQALLHLAQDTPGLNLIVTDGTKLFIEATDLAAFERLGGQVMAQRAIRMLGITLNPFSPFGGSFNAHDFLAQARQAFPQHLVTDVLLTKEGI